MIDIRRKLKRRPLSRTFLKGLIAIIPLTLTLYLFLWLAVTAELVLGNIFKLFFPNSWYIRGFGFLLGLGVVFLMGVFLETRTFLKKFKEMEQLVIQIPFIKSVYTAIRDFIALFSSNQSRKFKQVVLVDVPSGQGQQIGFITISDNDEVTYDFIADDQIAVFLPFSYQMGGNTVIMAKEKITEIEMSVEDALRFIATAGVIGSADS